MSRVEPISKYIFSINGQNNYRIFCKKEGRRLFRQSNENCTCQNFRYKQKFSPVGSLLHNLLDERLFVLMSEHFYRFFFGRQTEMHIVGRSFDTVADYSLSIGYLLRFKAEVKCKFYFYPVPPVCFSTLSSFSYDSPTDCLQPFLYCTLL